MTTNDITPEIETTPSKLSVLKSKITREGLILGGVTAGILIALGSTLLEAYRNRDEISDLTPEELGEMAKMEALVTAQSGV